MSKQRMVAVLFLLCSSRVARANDWTELGADSGQTRGSSEVSGALFKPSWTYSLGSGQIIATPVSAGGDVIVAGSDGAVAALNASDGTALWTRTMNAGVRATPTISGDQVAVSTMGGELISLNLADGQIAWQRAFGGQNYSSPQLVKKASADEADTLVIGAGFPSQDIWRFNALTGEPLWQTAKDAIAGIVNSTAAVAGDRVIVGMNGGRLQSLDLATGALGWKLDASGSVALSSPLVVGNRAYMFPGDKGADLFAADTSTGAPITGFPVGIPDLAPVAGGQMFGQGPAVSSPMTVGGLVIVQLRRNDMLPSNNLFKVVMRESVAAIDPVTAKVRWQYAVSTQTAPNSNGVPELTACPTPAGFSGPNGSYVVVSSSIEGRVAVLDASTGQELWTSALSSPGRSSPIFSNGQLLIATDDSVLHAFSSVANLAPTAPVVAGPSGDQVFEPAGTELNWQAASDSDNGDLSYIVRIQKEGRPETLAEAQAPVGQTRMIVSVEPSTAYLFAVRSRDAQGALSAWSVTRRIQIGAGSPSPINTTTQSEASATDPNTSPPSAGPTAPPQSDGTAVPSCVPSSSSTNTASTEDPSSSPVGSSSSPSPTPSSGSSPPIATGDELALPATAHTISAAAGTTTSSQDDVSNDPGLANRGGCSVSGRNGSSPVALLVGLVAIIIRRRTRSSSKRTA